MRRFCFSISMGIFVASGLLADIADPQFPPEAWNPELPQAEDEEGKGNILEMNVDAVGRAKMTKKPFRKDHFTYTDFDISFTKIVAYNPCKKEGIFLQVGYELDNLDWKHNPYFHQKNFSDVSLGAGFFSKRSEHWDYKGNIIVNFDAERANIAGYATVDYLLWARYSCCSDIGLHFGLLGLSGFKIDRLLPILGFDWKINDSWLLNVIFPIDFKILWKWNACWSLAIESRIWDSLHRVGQHEHLSKGVWEYRAYGFEGSVHYKHKGIAANVHVGYNCGGKLRISNKNSRHTKKIGFDGAPYAGGELSYTF